MEFIWFQELSLDLLNIMYEQLSSPLHVLDFYIISCHSNILFMPILSLAGCVIIKKISLNFPHRYIFRISRLRSHISTNQLKTVLTKIQTPLSNEWGSETRYVSNQNINSLIMNPSEANWQFWSRSLCLDKYICNKMES